MRAYLLLALSSVVNAAKAAPEPEGNAIVDYVLGLFNDIVGAAMAAGQDVAGIVMGAPRFAVNVLVWAVDFVRDLPELAENVFKGDAATLDDLASFASTTAGIVFVTYASLAALNLLVQLADSVRKAASPYLQINKIQPFGQKIPKPVANVLDEIQKRAINPVLDFNLKNWICPLGKQTGTPNLSNTAQSVSAALSTCVILSCAPSVLALIRGGANKGAAEALAYTLGTALGLQYLVKTVN